jgi:hypothetical protein
MARQIEGAYDSFEAETLSSKEDQMASLYQDPESGTFYVRLRFGGKSFKRLLDTNNQKLARGHVAGVDETLSLVRRGRISIPVEADSVAFILTDGKKLKDDDPKLLTPPELTEAFKANRIPGHKEANTIKTEDIHIRRLVRTLKGTSLIQTVGHTHLQSYVAKRLGEVVKGKAFSTETVRKEVVKCLRSSNPAQRTRCAYRRRARAKRSCPFVGDTRSI